MIIFVPGQARSNTCRAGTPTPHCRGRTVFVPLPPLGEHRGGPPEARAGTASGRRQLCWFPSPSAPFESKSHFHVIVPHKRGMRSSERLRPGTSPVPHCVRRQGHPHPEPWASSSLGCSLFPPASRSVPAVRSNARGGYFTAPASHPSSACWQLLAGGCQHPWRASLIPPIPCSCHSRH